MLTDQLKKLLLILQKITMTIVSLNSNDKEYILKKGQAFLHSPFSTHKDKTVKDNSKVYITSFSCVSNDLPILFDKVISFNKEEQFIQFYNLMKNASFLDIIFEMSKYEQNVADMMSIFISLCTDNAKELRLFMIGATPELLNLPLAMLTVGMDIQDVTDVCIQYIVPLMNQLNTNRYVNSSKLEVKDAISNNI